jgi:putative ABC transport system permease protein
VLTESLLQSLVGGALGTLIAVWTVNLISVGMPDATPPVFRRFEVDGLVLGFALLVTLATGLLFGLAPALQASRTDLAGTLKLGGPGTSGSVARQRLQSALVTGEIALALMLLIGAGLLMKSLVHLVGKNPGFNPEAVVTMQISLPEARYPGSDEVRSFFSRLDDALHTLPGVRLSGASNPLFGGWQDQFVIEGEPAAAPGEESWTEIAVVTRDYFRVLGIPLLAGRYFDERDREGSPPVAIVDRRFGETRWPGQDPIGKRIKRGNDPASERQWLEVVGVVETVKRYGEFFAYNSRICLYQPHQQLPARHMSLVVKADAPPEAVVAAVRSEVLELDPAQPVFNVRTMERFLADRLYVRRLVLSFLAVFAGVAVVLAAVGVYGLMAYSVSLRTRELGVRVAMGANARDVFTLVLGRGLKLTGLGVICGLLAAHLAAPLMESLLFGVAARDLFVFAALAVLVATVALGATVLPAHRATHISPVTALRSE